MFTKTPTIERIGKTSPENGINWILKLKLISKLILKLMPIKIHKIAQNDQKLSKKYIRNSNKQDLASAEVF